ncbi:MAG TPA: hypothetical protein PLS71_21775, partial [Leptospiraceae bacterium]|nr:hypothetical protein [Leptospiraceae bacterium]
MENKSILTDPKISAQQDSKSKEDSAAYIHMPTYSKITNLLKRILDLARDRHSQIKSLNGSESDVSSLLSLDYLHTLLQKETSLKETEKTPASINGALKQMLDSYTNGKEKYGYLYPILITEGNKIIPKIILIAPQKEKQTPIQPYRESCFQFSKKIIDQMLVTRAKNTRRSDDTTDTSLLRLSKSGSEWLFPKFLSVESELVSLLKKGFQPYAYIPLNDFIEDFTNYGLKSDKLVQILPDYHMIQEKVEFTDNGEFAKVPEVIYHYKSQVESLEKFVIKYLGSSAEKLKFNLYQTSIQQFREKYNTSYPDDPTTIKERMDALFDLISLFPGTGAQDENIKKILETCDESIQICKKLYARMDDLVRYKEKHLSTVFLNSVQKKIDDHTKEKMTLYILDLKTTLNKSNIQDKQLLYELEKELKQIIQTKYGYFESMSNEGREFFYVTHPGYMTCTIHNLTRLTIENKSYQKQLDIAKIIANKLEEARRTDIDSLVTEEDKQRLLKKIEEIRSQETQRLKRLEFRNNYNIFAGVAGFIISLIYFLILYNTYNDLIYALLSIPVSVFTGLLFSVLFRKKPFIVRNEKELEENESSESSAGSETEKTNQIIKASESYVFKSKFNSIDERIHDRNSLKETIKANLDIIKANSQIFAKEKNDEKIISTIENAMLFYSAVITV